MIDLKKSLAQDYYEFSDGTTGGPYGRWEYEILGYSIANVARQRYGKKLTPEEVEAIVCDVEERIDEHVWDLINECIEGMEG